jgi:hypothetical protein
MPISYPQIRGHRYGWSSVQIVLDKLKMTGFQSIDYSDSLDPGEVRGTRAALIGRTRGEYSAEGSLVFYREEFEEFGAMVAAGASLYGTTGLMEVSFPIIVQYSEVSNIVIQDLLEGVRLKKIGGGGSEGPDASVIECDLSIMRIKWGGRASLKDEQEIFQR